MKNLTDKFYQWLAWKLPRRLVTWASIRLMAAATTGKYAHVVTPEVTIIEALQRWTDGKETT